MTGKQATTIRSLSIRFLWQFILFVICVLGISGLLYVVDKDNTSFKPVRMKGQYIENRRVRMVNKLMNRTAVSAVQHFGQKHELKFSEIHDFVTNMTRAFYFGVLKPDMQETYTIYRMPRRGMNFVQAFVLTYSTLTTVGWGHHLPVTDGAKILTMLTAIFGIPLTFIMILSGSTLITRLAKEAEIKIFGNRESGTHKFDRPIMVGFILIYMFVTSCVIMKLEKLDYLNALWYTLMSLMTVGFTDIIQRRRVTYGREDELIGVAIFQMIWLVIGMILIGGFALSLLDRYLMKTNSGSFHRFQIFKNKEEDLVENMEEEVFEERS
eukprot:TCONS_00049394-protein